MVCFRKPTCFFPGPREPSTVNILLKLVEPCKQLWELVRTAPDSPSPLGCSLSPEGRTAGRRTSGTSPAVFKAPWTVSPRGCQGRITPPTSASARPGLVWGDGSSHALQRERLYDHQTQRKQAFILVEIKEEREASSSIIHTP